MRMPVVDSHMVDVTAEVVNVYVPLLLGLKLMTRLKMVIDFDKDPVRSKSGVWNKSLIRKLGHVFVVWPVQIL